METTYNIFVWDQYGVHFVQTNPGKKRKTTLFRNVPFSPISQLLELLEPNPNFQILSTRFLAIFLSSQIFNANLFRLYKATNCIQVESVACTCEVIDIPILIDPSRLKIRLFCAIHQTLSYIYSKFIPT